jgi:hypothetical protein
MAPAPRPIWPEEAQAGPRRPAFPSSGRATALNRLEGQQLSLRHQADLALGDDEALRSLEKSC